MTICSKLALGTAQFGMPYGVTNHVGVVPTQQVKDILDYAYANRISLLDTAGAYGCAEKTLGQGFSENAGVFKVVTKIAFNLQADQKNTAAASVAKSLHDLKLSAVYAVLAHHADQLLSKQGQAFYAQLITLKNNRITEKIGVSVYTPEQVQELIDYFDIDIIQLPLNLLDRRLITSGLLTQLKQRNIEIHARSAFLQGVLTEPPDYLPDYFLPYRSLLNKYWQLLHEYDLTAPEAALNYVYALPEVDYIVVGVTCLSQLRQLLNIRCRQLPAQLIDTIQSNDIDLINPGRWQTSC